MRVNTDSVNFGTGPSNITSDTAVTCKQGVTASGALVLSFIKTLLAFVRVTQYSCHECSILNLSSQNKRIAQFRVFYYNFAACEMDPNLLVFFCAYNAFRTFHLVVSTYTFYVSALSRPLYFERNHG